MNSILDNDKIDLFGEKKMETTPASSGQTTTTTINKSITGLGREADKNCSNVVNKIGTLTTRNLSSDNSATISASLISPSSTTTLTTTTTNASGSLNLANTDSATKPALAPATANMPSSNSSHELLDTVGPISKKSKVRPAPYVKPILLTGDRKTRKRKSITWQPDEKITSIRFFEMIEDERTNVTKQFQFEMTQQLDQPSGSHSVKVPNAASIDGSYKRASGKNESDKPIEYSHWRPLILIDFTPTLPSPGWNSVERTAQAEREVYVLGAIDLPGKPSTLDEPDPNNTATKDDGSDIKIIPLDNPDGMYTEYGDMYNSDIVNGVRISSDNPPAIVQNIMPFSDQYQNQTQLLPNQFQQQLVQATSQHNPFSFPEMSAQFAQQTLAFQQHQPMPMSFANAGQPQQLPPTQQQQQQPIQPSQQQQPNSITGPIMPWLNYPFNSVSENSHAHLFRRPAT